MFDFIYEGTNPGISFLIVVFFLFAFVVGLFIIITALIVLIRELYYKISGKPRDLGSGSFLDDY